MVARAHSQAELDTIAAAGAQQFRNRIAGVQAEVENEALVEGLGANAEVAYRGRRFRVGPLSYLHGRKLDRIRRRLEELKQQTDGASLAEIDGLVAEALVVFAEIVRPWWLRWLPNPFRAASDTEVGSLLGVFTACRFLSGVAFHSPNPAPNRAR